MRFPKIAKNLRNQRAGNGRVGDDPRRCGRSWCRQRGKDCRREKQAHGNLGVCCGGKHVYVIW